MKVSQKRAGASVLRTLLIIRHTGWGGDGPEPSLSHPGCDQAELEVLYSLFQTRPLTATCCVWSLGLYGSDQGLTQTLPRLLLLLGYTFTNT